MNPLQKHIGMHNDRKHRAKGLTQKQLATQLNVKATMIADYGLGGLFQTRSSL